jgi:hypothetical protein
MTIMDLCPFFVVHVDPNIRLASPVVVTLPYLPCEDLEADIRGRSLGAGAPPPRGPRPSLSGRSSEERVGLGSYAAAPVEVVTRPAGPVLVARRCLGRPARRRRSVRRRSRSG